MAILHYETAQWPKSQAYKRFNLLLFTFAIIAMPSFALMGFGIQNSNHVIAIVAPTVGILLLLILARLLNKTMRQVGKDRIRYWRGAQAESFVAWLIQTELDDSWHLINSIKLRQDSDIDHILIGPGGVFSISTKSHRGYFSLAPDNTLQFNGSPTHFAKQALSQALDLRSCLEASMGDKAPFVQPILAAPFTFVSFPEKSQKVWLLHQENLTDALGYEASKRRLTRSQVSQLVRTVQSLNH